MVFWMYFQAGTTNLDLSIYMVKNTPCRSFYFQTFFLLLFLVHFFGHTLQNTEIKESGISERLIPKPFYKNPTAFFFAGQLAPPVLVKPDIPSSNGGFKMGNPIAPNPILTLPSFSIPFYSFDFLILNILYPYHFFF